MTLEYQLLLSLTLIHTVALASPGPDFALVVKLATQTQRKTALASALGLAVAITLHTLLSLTGISLIITSAENVYIAIQLIGASYLAWMGLGAIREAITHWQDRLQLQVIPTYHRELTMLQGFTQGLSTNLLNPKAMVFFITLFSTLISPTVNIETKVAVTLLMFLLSLIWFSLIALVLSKPVIQQKMQRATPMINLITGLLFVSVTLVIIHRLL
ncbi:LysE family translocator [Shewanella algidipiscicola]|uniref:Lysine transporter LysE n=1 Tax=Shewanella algidipiscicola TaxID=614070 RepID=A0ABQ4PJV1_9GAMM|nr:LysE family translocator [Shewanella algidipiscicola]GIU48069.1 lysine transporter LysE [Shewanella algidipiscicola]